MASYFPGEYLVHYLDPDGSIIDTKYGLQSYDASNAIGDVYGGNYVVLRVIRNTKHLRRNYLKNEPN